MSEPALNPCPTCGSPADFYSRWRYTGNGPAELIYVWGSCPNVPPCFVGECWKDAEKAAKAWNRETKPKKRRTVK